MPNRNYKAGRSEEYACMKRWKLKGYDTVRSAGSHGIWDVCAVKTDRSVELIQCKLTESESVAKHLLANFKDNPPYPPDIHFHQVLEVRIKGSRTIYSATI